jgi:hypothetical protein
MYIAIALTLGTGIHYVRSALKWKKSLLAFPIF